MEDEKPHNTPPPRWAQCLLEWYCRPELLEDLQGDLNEFFERNSKIKGARRAVFIYVIDVFKFIRLYTLRKPEFLNLFIQWIMIGSYIKTSGRSIVRNKLFSTINIVGLAISMSVGLLLIGLLSDLFSYDQFHEKRNHIYRVISGYEYLGKADNSFYGSTSLRTGKAIQESIPGIEDMAVLRRGFRGDVKTIDKTVPLQGLWANESLFNVFTFPMLAGDRSTALKNPFSIVLTEKSAKKLFGESDPIGKTVIPFDDKEFVVTGVIKDVPLFSHMKFDMLGSISTREITEKENKEEMQWDNMWSAYVYLLLPPNTDLQTLQDNLTRLATKEDESVKNTKIKLALQALPDIALGEDLNNSIGPVMDSSVIWIIGALSFIVVLSACFNYTNLSIARSLRRSREVGIRKVIGALNSHVLGQFIVEAIIISLLALAFSFVLFLLLRPYFLSINPKLQEMALLHLSPKVVLYFILLAISVGVAAGFFPALFFARINAVQVLKAVSTLRVFRNVNMRKALIVSQYTISLMFIATTIIGYKQYKHYLAFNLGFNTENIVNIELRGNKADLLLKDLSEMPEIKGLSKSMMVTSVGDYYGTRMKYINPQDSVGVYFNTIDENYLPLHGHKLLTGRNFAAKVGKVEESEVIVSEDVLKYFNIGGGDPVKALGEMVTIDGKKMQVIGVMKNFHYGKADNNNEDTNRAARVVFRYSNEKAEYVNAKIISTDWPATLAAIDKAWRRIDQVHPLEAKFYSEEIERSYGEFSALIKIVGFLAFLAICIASLGLLGMVVFTTETRLKEISIRKVLGASELKLIFLLSKGFLFLLALAGFIALPTTYLIFDRIVLADFANPAPISLMELLSGVLLVITIAFIMLGSQTLKVARTNPAEVLKNE